MIALQSELVAKLKTPAEEELEGVREERISGEDAERGGRHLDEDDGEEEKA